MQTADNSLKEALAELITLGLKVEQFVIDQAPNVIQELLHWKFLMSIIDNVLAALFLALIYWLFQRACKLSWDSDTAGLLHVIGIVVGGVGFFCGINIVWYKIMVAPKVYLIEYAAKLIQ